MEKLHAQRYIGHLQLRSNVRPTFHKSVTDDFTSVGLWILFKETGDIAIRLKLNDHIEWICV